MYTSYINIYGIEVSDWIDNLLRYDTSLFDNIEGLHTESNYRGACAQQYYFVGKSYGVIGFASPYPIEYPDQDKLDKDWKRYLARALNGINMEIKKFPTYVIEEDTYVSDISASDYLKGLKDLKKVLKRRKPKKKLIATHELNYKNT